MRLPVEMHSSKQLNETSFLLKQLKELAMALRSTNILRQLRHRSLPTVAGAARQQKADDIILSELAARRRGGETYAAMAMDLNRRGLRGDYGGRWYASSVRAALRRLEHK